MSAWVAKTNIFQHIGIDEESCYTCQKRHMTPKNVIMFQKDHHSLASSMVAFPSKPGTGKHPKIATNRQKSLNSIEAAFYLTKSTQLP